MQLQLTQKWTLGIYKEVMGNLHNQMCDFARMLHSISLWPWQQQLESAHSKWQHDANKVCLS